MGGTDEVGLGDPQGGLQLRELARGQLACASRGVEERDGGAKTTLVGLGDEASAESGVVPPVERVEPCTSRVEKIPGGRSIADCSCRLMAEERGQVELRSVNGSAFESLREHARCGVDVPLRQSSVGGPVQVHACTNSLQQVRGFISS